MAEPGTLENLALILGKALAPLADELQPGRALTLLNRLGLGLPASSVTPQLSSALGAGATAAGQLPALIGDLAGAIEIDAGGVQIGLKAAPLVAKIVTIIDSVTTIANQLKAITAPGLSGPEIAAFAQALPRRLLDYLLVGVIEREQPTFAALLSLFGVIEYTRINPGSTDPQRPEIDVKSLNLRRIGNFFSSPDQLALQLYGWGGGFDAPKLLDRFYGLLSGIGLPVARGETPGPNPRPAIEFFLAQLAGTAPGINPPGLELTVQLAVGDGFELSFPIADGLELDIKAQGSVAASTGVHIQPPANLSLVPPSGSVQGSLTAGLARVPATGEQVVTLFGVAGGTGLTATRLSIGLKTIFAWNPVTGQATGDFGMEGRIEGGKLVISLAGADGFIGSIMSGFGLEADFDLGFGWTAGHGVFFTGSGGLEVQVPAHIQLGPVEIMALAFRIGIVPTGFPITLSADIKGSLGPVQAVIEGIGATAAVSFPTGHSGNLGPVDLAFAFKAPDGVGLAIDAGIIAGGGYLRIDTARGEYAGALQLEFAEFLSLAAIGLITTRNPDGSPGFSLLIVITAEFPGGGIQLGYGFTLLAVGGLLGLNRSMNLQALMQGVRTGAIESVMFPHDVVANAPRILSDLRTFFPAKPGTFLIGPMLKLGWGTPTLISVAVGVIIEIPGNIAIVGVLKVALPTEEAALIKLQVNFAGAIEFDKQRLYFFAALFESRILFMTIEGEMGLLVAWGDDANFVLSVGGFHPRFDPPPLPFPSPRRIVVSILDTDWARIRVTNYFAVTSNTVQFGASAELYFGFSAISIEGHIGFDALFQVSPFHFIVEISASVSLKIFGMGVFGIRLHFTLEGTSPWRARGEGSISFLFFDVSADFDVTWGEPKDTQLEPADVQPLLVTELNNAVSWHVQLPPGSALPLSLQDTSIPDDQLVLHPMGALRVRQRAVPLDLTITKVGSRKARDANKFTLTVAGTAFVKRADVTERFAMAQYLDLDDAAKLSRPAFEQQHGGIELAGSGNAPGSARMVRRVVRYEEIIIDNQFRRRQRRFRPLAAGLFDHFLGGASVARSSMSQAQKLLRDPHGDAIATVEHGYVVASAVNNSVLTGTTVFTSQAAAMEHLESLSAADPNLAAHVIPSFEASGAP